VVRDGYDDCVSEGEEACQVYSKGRVPGQIRSRMNER
jgi:hypothetical protein